MLMMSVLYSRPSRWRQQPNSSSSSRQYRAHNSLNHHHQHHQQRCHRRRHHHRCLVPVTSHLPTPDPSVFTYPTYRSDSANRTWGTCSRYVNVNGGKGVGGGVDPSPPLASMVTHAQKRWPSPPPNTCALNYSTNLFVAVEMHQNLNVMFKTLGVPLHALPQNPHYKTPGFIPDDCTQLITSPPPHRVNRILISLSVCPRAHLRNT